MFRASLAADTRALMPALEDSLASLITREAVARSSTGHRTGTLVFAGPRAWLYAWGAGLSTRLGATRVSTANLGQILDSEVETMKKKL